MLAERLEGEDRRTKGLDAQLLGRYATKAVLASVKAVYESEPGWQDCETADGLVLYFLKVEPDYGVRRVAQKPSSCVTPNNALAAVVRMKRWNEVEPAIIARLNDPNMYSARSAAETLARYGSPKAEKAMWERLRRFHKQWAERANELNSRPQMPREALEAMGFQFGLVEALGRAQAWLLTNEQITELESLTLGSEQENVKHWRWRSPIDLSINFLFDERMQADVNHQYSAADTAALVSKLAQYPSGTTFQLTTFGPPTPVLREIDQAAADHGLIVESPSQR